MVAWLNSDSPKETFLDGVHIIAEYREERKRITCQNTPRTGKKGDDPAYQAKTMQAEAAADADADADAEAEADADADADAEG